MDKSEIIEINGIRRVLINGIWIIQDIPDIFFNALINQFLSYDKGDADISVTEIIKPARAWILEKEYAEQIETLASLQLSALMGGALHYLIEQGAEDDYIVEERAFREIDGWCLSGKFDAYYKPTCKLSDWKSVSVWDYVFNDDTERLWQLNMLKWLNLRYKIDYLEIGYYYRDFALSVANRSESGKYPEKQTLFKIFKPKPDDEIESYIKGKLGVLTQYSHDNRLPRCTDEERWLRGTEWRCMKKGRKSAVKVFKVGRDDNPEEQAVAYCKANGLNLEYRPGEFTRCRLTKDGYPMYCNCRNFCEQAKEND